MVQLSSIIRDLTRGKRRRAIRIFVTTCVVFSLVVNSMVGIEWLYVKRRILCSHIMHRGGQRQLSDECATVWEPAGTGAMAPLEDMFPVTLHEEDATVSTANTPPASGVAYVIHYTQCPLEVLANHTELAENEGNLRGLADATTVTTETAPADATTSMGVFIDSAAIMHHSIACTVPDSQASRTLDSAAVVSGLDVTDAVVLTETTTSSGNNGNNGNGGHGVHGGNGNGGGGGVLDITPDVTTTTVSTFLQAAELGDATETRTVVEPVTEVEHGQTQTVYAIMTPDCVKCMGPHGVEYDRAELLQSLGYWVKIWENPVDETMLTGQTYIRDNIGDDVGLKDLMPLHALKLDDHEFAVVLDQNYVLTAPLDSVFEALRASDDIMAYVSDPTSGVSKDILVLKPSVNLYDDIVDTYVSVPYTPESGWGDTGIGTYNGGMGTSGLLDYYLHQTPEGERNLTEGASSPTGLELDRCTYDNNADGNCNAYPFEEVVGYVMHGDVCGQPWMCQWGILQNDWDDATHLMCQNFLVHWIQGREQFQTYFFNQPTNMGDGAYHVEVYHGLCSGEGPENYIPMLSDEQPARENCLNGDLQFYGCDLTYTEPTTSTIGSGLELEVIATSPAQCEVFIAGPNNVGAEVPFQGTARISGVGNPDTSMVFVIDRSGSTCDVSGLQCALSDQNGDGNHDDALDCEIAAVLDLVEKARADGTVDHVGLVSYSNQLSNIVSATIELPLTDIDLFDVNSAHAIESSIRSVRCGGGTNYAAAVQKACEVIEPSLSDHNVVIFMSDGVPNAGGAPTGYCNNNAVFHTIALGVDASCSGGVDTSLMEIALATSGTCQEVSNIPDIRPVLLEIGDIQFLSIQGSSVASEGIVNFGCEDVANYSNSIGIQCKDIGVFCGSYLASDAFSNLGHSGDSACCVCGGGLYMNVGDLEAFEPEEDTSQYRKVVNYEDTATLHEGVHKVCTTVMAAEAGFPGANVQCRDILVCPRA